MLSRPGIQELERLAADAGFAIEPAEEGEYAVLTEAILGVLDGLEAQVPAPMPVLEAVRDPGGPARPGEDPYNAIVRWCSVKVPGAEGVLSGKRVALKDSIAVAGIPLTCGSRALAGYVPAADSVVTERILLAGGEIVAVTNMDDLAFSGGGDSSCYGPTRNPFDESRTAGGSSSGSAAALSYEGVDLGVGTDQGGSIRVPSAWCGVVGLKPTHGLVPYTGIAGIDRTFDHCGPIARTAAAAAALLQAIAGAHESDPRQRGVPARDYVRAVEEAPDDLRGVTLGIVAESLSPEAGAEPVVVEAVEAVAERLARLGADVRRVSLPAHLQAAGIAFAGFVEGMYDLVTSGGNGYAWAGRYWEDLPGVLGPGLRARAQELSAQVKIMLVLGAHLRRQHSSRLYAKAQNLRPWLVAAHGAALADVDALLYPTTPGLPHVLDPLLPLAERVLRGWTCLANTTPTDMTGHPAITLPLAEAGGLPVGVMLVGRHWDDDRLLALAATCEQALGWVPARSE